MSRTAVIIGSRAQISSVGVFQHVAFRLLTQFVTVFVALSVSKDAVRLFFDFIFMTIFHSQAALLDLLILSIFSEAK